MGRMRKHFANISIVLLVLLLCGCATQQKKETVIEKKSVNENISVMVTTGTRFLPESCKPGDTIVVKIDIVPAAQISGVIVAEKLPEGWKIIKSAPSFSKIETNSTYKWLQWAQQVMPFSIAYEVKIPENAKGVYKFEGKITTYREGDIPIIGKSEIKVK